jgi:hypothetical protein
MKHFIILYSVKRGINNYTFAIPIEVEFTRHFTAYDKYRKIINGTVFFHNTHEETLSKVGNVVEFDIEFRCITEV